MERRKFITVVGTAALAAPIVGSMASCASESKSFEGHKFPELGYAFNALEPYIDAQTMELHYTKHHRGYYDKFMAAAEGTDLLTTPMEQIFAKISEQPVAVRNNGGGYFNHALFWENMTPSQTEMPSDLKSALERDFGSVDSFKEKFNTAAKTHFGSGWAWLIAGSNGNLLVTSTPNQDNTLMDISDAKGTPLLGIDIWEHAYYLKYQNRRAEYVDNFWNLINWNVVNKRLSESLG